MTNSFGCLKIFDKDDNYVISSVEHYLAVSHGQHIRLYNTEVCMYPLMSVDVSKPFNKQQELKCINEIVLNNLSCANEGPKIFKILANCMKEIQK